MNILKKLLAFAILAAASSSAFAEEKANELSISGSITSTTPDVGASSTTTNVNFSYGRYITEQLVLTVSDFISLTSTSGSSTGIDLIGLGAKYYLSSGKKGDFVPFGEAGVNFGVIDSSIYSYSTGGVYIGGGASYYLSETTSADLHLDFSSQNVSGSGVSYSQTQTQFLVGLTQRF